MIKEFCAPGLMDSGVVFESQMRQIEKLYERDPQMAGELAIACMEVALKGEHSSDDFMIDMMLENMKVVADRNIQKYKRKVDASKLARIDNFQLELIAKCYKEGMTQKEIAQVCNETKKEKIILNQQQISYRMTVIRTEYPELLQDDYEPEFKDEHDKYWVNKEKQKIQKEQKIQKAYTDTENDNENYNYNNTDTDTSNDTDTDTSNNNSNNTVTLSNIGSSCFSNKKQPLIEEYDGYIPSCLDAKIQGKIYSLYKAGTDYDRIASQIDLIIGYRPTEKDINTVVGIYEQGEELFG